MAKELDEETRRLIKLFRPAKDAETSWRIDVSAELAWYLHMIQQRASEDDENATTTNQGLAAVVADDGLNFSQASAVVMEATRIFSRKVDFLRKQMDSTLTNILAGVGPQTARKKRKQRVATTTSSALQQWELPEIPDAVEIMHLPLDKLIGGPIDALDSGKHIIPAEHRLHHLSRSDCKEVVEAGGGSDDEAMAEDASPKEQAVFDWRLRTTFPICPNLKEVATLKRQTLSRPCVHLLAPVQVNPALADVSEHFKLIRFFNLHAISRAALNSHGVLSLPSYKHMFLRHNPPSGERRFSFSPQIGGGGAGECSALPTFGGGAEPSALPGGTLAGSTLPVSSGRFVTPPAPQKKPKPSNDELHDEHATVGTDAPLRVGNTTQRVNVALYTRTLADVVASFQEATDDTGDLLDAMFIALTGSYGVDRFCRVNRSTRRRNLPYFTDVKVGTKASGHSGTFGWRFPAKAKPEKTKPAGSVSGDSGFDEVGGAYDELDFAVALPEDGTSRSAFTAGGGNESIMLMDTFSRMDGRLSIIGNQSVSRTNNKLSEMHERIGLWRQRVDQWMKVAEDEETFDIPKYVERIVDAKEEQTSTCVSFKDICRGAKRHEVCRLFLTSLILVNRFSLSVAQEEENDFRLDMQGYRAGDDIDKLA